MRRFLLEQVAGSHVTTMTIDDVAHFTAEEKARDHCELSGARAGGAHQGRADAWHRPHLSGPEESIAIEQRDFPQHWPRIGGMDFGWDHPFAAVELVLGSRCRRVYVTQCHRVREATPVLHAAAIRPWGICFGRGRVMAGAKRWKAPALRLAEQYQRAGPRHAQRARAVRWTGQRVGRGRA